MISVLERPIGAAPVGGERAECRVRMVLLQIFDTRWQAYLERRPWDVEDITELVSDWTDTLHRFVPERKTYLMIISKYNSI